MRASSLYVQGRAFNEPRPDLAHRRRRRGIRGAFSLVIFLLCEQEKVTRALDARGKAKGRGHRRIKSENWMTNCIRSLPFGPFAPRRFATGILPSQSVFAGMTNESRRLRKPA